jgi:hypothetical protein
MNEKYLWSLVPVNKAFKLIQAIGDNDLSTIHMFDAAL